jgi:CubicO group peptidase (beta-lactamase class C family)/beta-glucosidase-like glycosyl hydrolase
MPKKIFTGFILFLILLELILIVHALFFFQKTIYRHTKNEFLNVNPAWADTLIKNMSISEKAAQLLMIEINQAQIDEKKELQKLIKKINPGGILFLKTNIKDQILLTNASRSTANIPLIIASRGSIINQADFNFPTGMFLNAAKDSLFIERYTEAFAEILSYASVNIDFSAQLNQYKTGKNAQYYYSDDKNRNLKIALKWNTKLNDKKIISCIYNFKDKLLLQTKDDSVFHKKLKKELSVFHGLSISNAHINDSLKQYLEKKYAFKGLLFSDWNPDISDSSLLKSIKSGINMFFVKNEPEKFINKIKLLISRGLLKESELNKRVKQILLAKTWFGLNKPAFHSAEYNLQRIFTNEYKKISWQIYERTTTLVLNKKQVLPFRNFAMMKVLFYSANKTGFSVLQQSLRYYFDFQTTNSLNTKSYFSHLIIAIHPSDSLLLKDSSFIKQLRRIAVKKKLIVLNFASPLLCNTLNFSDAIIQLYDTHPFSQSIAAQIISGAITPQGKLPVKLNHNQKNIVFKPIARLQYTIPEIAGFDSYLIKKIDTIISQAEQEGVAPGFQIMAIKNGKVFFYKSYGYHTYLQQKKVNNFDLFDLASITKVAATTLASMKLYEWDSIHPEDSLKYYLQDTNILLKNHRLYEFYVHKSGLQANMPILQYINFHDTIINNPKRYFSENQDSLHHIQVAENFYLRDDLHDSIINSLYNMEFDSLKNYQYSDINFNILFMVIQGKINQPLDVFLKKHFYLPLGLRTMCFLPLRYFDKNRILPTSNDKYWRKQVVLGYPHDESAALFGGIAGNAGLFSNANDLEILFQMLINGGKYAGKRYLKAETVELFTSPQKDSPRGLGFNRKQGAYFGHSGFTGCSVWANPVTGFVFVFLSNSIYPDVKNKKLRRYKIREKVFNSLLVAEIQNNNSAIIRLVRR